jgi:hypothetical protein
VGWGARRGLDGEDGYELPPPPSRVCCSALAGLGPETLYICLGTEGCPLLRPRDPPPSPRTPFPDSQSPACLTPTFPPPPASERPAAEEGEAAGRRKDRKMRVGRGDIHTERETDS